MDSKTNIVVTGVFFLAGVVGTFAVQSYLGDTKDSTDAVKIREPQIEKAIADIEAQGADIQDLKARVQSLEILVGQFDAAIKKVEEWQEMWPTQGELASDIRQNKDIEFLKAVVSEAKVQIDEHRKRIRDIEMGHVQ